MSNFSAIGGTSPSQCETNKLSLLFSKNGLRYYLGTAILATLMTGVTITLNSILLATMWSKKRLHTSISNKLLIILFMVDLLQGISIWPLVAANFIIYHRVDSNCFLMDTFIIIGYYLVGMTLTTIFLVTLEQYIAILHPYFYISHVTFYKLVIPTILSISLLIIIDIIGIIKWDLWLVHRRILFTVLGITIVTALIHLHTKVIRCASRIVAKITDTNRGEGRQIKSRAKAAKSGLIVLVATLVTYCPNMCFIIYERVT